VNLDVLDQKASILDVLPLLSEICSKHPKKGGVFL